MNDTPDGFWAANLKSLGEAWNAAFPTAIGQADKQVMARQLDAQISWVPVKIRWGQIELLASMNDGQMSLQLGSGGTLIQGQITLVVSKIRFGGKYPENNDEIEITVNGRWQPFHVTEVLGQFNDSDESLTLTCAPEDIDNG